MKRLHIIILVLLALAVGGWFVGARLFISEERRVAMALDSLLESFEQSGKETIVVAASKAKSITRHFASDFSAEPGPPFTEVSDERAFLSLITSFRVGTQSLNLRTVSRDVLVNNDRASVVTTISARYNGMGEVGTEVREFQIDLRKTDGDWLLTKVDLLDGGN